MLGIETVRSSDFNVVFIFWVFLEFGNQVLFERPGVEKRCAGELPDKDATGGVFDRIAGMDTDALKARYIVHQREHATEMRGLGQRQFVPPERDGPLGWEALGTVGGSSVPQKGLPPMRRMPVVSLGVVLVLINDNNMVLIILEKNI